MDYKVGQEEDRFAFALIEESVSSSENKAHS